MQLLCKATLIFKHAELGVVIQILAQFHALVPHLQKISVCLSEVWHRLLVKKTRSLQVQQAVPWSIQHSWQISLWLLTRALEVQLCFVLLRGCAGRAFSLLRLQIFWFFGFQLQLMSSLLCLPTFLFLYFSDTCCMPLESKKYCWNSYS